MIFNNYTPQSVSDKGKTQATLHSRFARVGEYPFSSSSLHFLTRISYGNSTKLNIQGLTPKFPRSFVGKEQLNKMNEKFTEEDKWIYENINCPKAIFLTIITLGFYRMAKTMDYMRRVGLW